LQKYVIIVDEITDKGIEMLNKEQWHKEYYIN